ncbi:MAG: PhoH family protein [Planctomycetota bacterium]|nr:MAG: PhoH family protein [Planctomycetota bacterium]
MEKVIHLENAREAQSLFGNFDQNLRYIQKKFKVLNIVARNSLLRLEGEEEEVAKAEQLFQNLLEQVRKKKNVEIEEIDAQMATLGIGNEQEMTGDEESKPGFSMGIPHFKAYSEGQKKYVEAIENHDLTFAYGPAGTGKTYIAVVMATWALRQGKVQRIVLVRPAVEAGEKLGFLPGDFQEKVNPYLRPLYDALNDILGAGKMKKYFDRDVIEVIPLAYMRGRTLNRSFIILDEAQNTTIGQMKMFLTRMGQGSKIVVTGDISQVDLPEKNQSGLISALKILKGIPGISFVELSTKDIVRHPLIHKIIQAYESQEKGREK